VLGARIGGIPELIQEGVTGELFESGNVEELKEKVDKLWKDTPLTEEYGKNCAKEIFAAKAEYASKLLSLLG